MTQESEFRPSLVGRILDLTINAGVASVPADILIGLLRTMGPYKEVLEGKIREAEKVETITGNFNSWYARLYHHVHRGDEVGA